MIFLIFLSLGQGCHPQAGAIKAETNPDSVSHNNQNMLSCYTLKPVFQDAKDIEEDSLYWPGYNPNLEVLKISIDSYMQNFDLKAKPHFDSSMKYITSFEYQAEIAINHDCLDNLNHPDDIFLQQIYFPLQSLPLGNYSFSPVSFTGMEKRFIFNFGHALVYKYSLKAADVSPHFLYIFLKDSVDLSQNSGFSQGIVLCCQRCDLERYSRLLDAFFQAYIWRSWLPVPS